MAASKQQVIELLTQALRQPTTISHRWDIIPNGGIKFDVDKTSGEIDIDFVYSLPKFSNNKLRLLLSFKNEPNGDLCFFGNCVQGLQYLGESSQYWCDQLNSFFHEEYPVWENRQFFIVNNGWLFYVFNFRYSEDMQKNVISLCNNMLSTILREIEYAYLPLVVTVDFGSNRPWPIIKDVAAI